MPLLGAPLLVTIGAALLVATALTLLVWPRAHGPRPVRVMQRLAMLLALQLLAVLLAADAVNNYGYFYGSWQDLFGGATQPVSVQHVAGGPHRYLVPVGASSSLGGLPAPWSTPAQYPSRGAVQVVRLAGARTGLSTQAFVYLPPQYFQPRYRTTRFPAVQVYTGYPGSVLSLVARMNYPGQLLARLNAHRAEPMVLVMLDPSPVLPRDTECTDVPGGPQVETYLAEDVPAAVGAQFRVRALGWGAMGDSTGGYCATKVTMDHPDVFSAAVSLSGYYHTLSDPTTGDLWGGSSTLRNLNDLEWRLRNLPAPPVSVFASIGTQEGGATGVSDTRAFQALVRRPMSADVVYVPGGGHNWTDWRQVVPRAFDWLAQHLR